ncbi:MAG: hypothetical protein R3D05_20110, partial [Dongiaceae bacterium]
MLLDFRDLAARRRPTAAADLDEAHLGDQPPCIHDASIGKACRCSVISPGRLPLRPVSMLHSRNMDVKEIISHIVIKLLTRLRRS